MSRRSFPQIDPAALRDHAEEARVERIWERVERTLESRAGSTFAERRRARRASLSYVAIAAAFGAFGAGVLLGKATWDRPPAALAPLAMPDVEKSQVEILAAGTQQRTIPLKGGGGLTLSPGATIEAEHAGSEVTLSLLQGEASIDSAGRTLTVVADETRINTQSGSLVSVRRNADSVDVKVDRGSANVSSPAGPSVLAENQRATVPLHTSVSAAPVDAVAAHRAHDRALPPRPRKGPHPNLAKLANAPEWFTHYPAEGPQAIALLRKQGVDQAIAQAHSSAELSAIAELMSGQDQGAVVRAYERLLKDYPNDTPRAFFAARELGRIYEARGETARAKEFREKETTLAKNTTAGGDVILCNVIHREPDKTLAAMLAKEYLDKYPDGECRDEFERQVQAEASAAPAPAAPADVGTAAPAAPSATPKAPPPSP